MTAEDDEHHKSLRFGPFESLRAITDLQVQGIRAASQMAERFTRILEGSEASPAWPPPASTPGAADGAPETELVGEMRANVGRLMDLYGQLFERTFEAYVDLVGRRRGESRIDAGATDDVQVEAAAGSVAAGDLWLHNHLDEPVPPMSLRVSSMTAGDGSTVDAAQVSLEPSTVTLGPRETARVSVEVKVPEDATPGVYRGFVLIQDQPDQAQTLTLTVVDDNGSTPR